MIIDCCKPTPIQSHCVLLQPYRGTLATITDHFITKALGRWGRGVSEFIHSSSSFIHSSSSTTRLRMYAGT